MANDPLIVKYLNRIRELEKRVKELENKLTEASWQRDYDRQMIEEYYRNDWK